MTRARRGEDADLSPVIKPDPLDPRVSLSTIIHWADSHAVRVDLMTAVEFPVDDVPMFLVVNQLSYRGAMRPSDLALALGTGRANLTKIAHRLHDAGLIVRVPEPSDERGVLLALTPQGREIGERIMERVQRDLESALADWSEEDVTTLKGLLARLARDAPGRHR
ncbi:DNA-binding transcriptional regulator, MarR family [Nonomuraea solani]|uniref:DNA-binding transcriptional regulator, MarR family n=1 Tax=Nonomuraea solani TaxID=1144553 RepID=A0A1H6EUP8_9ACTN|nr:MarR family transcriptional regulator [Nonomuraea solani]SEH01103.1 DNA-binding transcriptional regulator, MarR family [Nonomuraea solani]